MKTLKIGSINLKNPIVLAPMLDITDLPFRLLCRKAGASLAYTEMIHTSAMLHKNKKTSDTLKTTKADSPLGIQITGSSISEFKSLIPKLKNYDLVDINCACPSDKITGSKAGAYLLNNPKKIYSIIKILKSSGLTVTAKVRLGFSEFNVMEVAKQIEKAGADALTIHARLASQGYNAKADWNWIKRVKQNIGIPVIGNGDINSGEKAKEMLEIADGAMVGRAAIGNPLIFKQILHYLKTEREKAPKIKDNLNQFKQYISLAKKYNLINIPKIKHLGAHFIKGINNASSLREKLMHLKSIKEIQKFIKEIK